MMEKEQLRQADVLTGILFFLFGLFILSQAFQMPMKDSWGGVQNVWYVSPALFPILVGTMISFLGILLIIIALKRLGITAFKIMLTKLLNGSFFPALASDAALRFYSITVLLFFYVYLYIPRVDFILCSIIFMITFTTTFYYDNPVLLKKLMALFTGGSFLFLIYFATGINHTISQSIPFFTDISALFFIVVLGLYAKKLAKNDSELTHKFKICMLVSGITPFVLGTIFKFFLLVPLMNEGAVIKLMETIWYMEF